MLEPKVYSVSRVSGYIKTMLESDYVLSSIWVAGEISNFKRHGSGNLFFSLKDSDSVIRCVMFKGDAAALPFMPENGMSVIICGYVTVYERSGEYQIVVQLMKPDGVGALTIAFEQLKEKLASEGLFDSDFKREINRRPSNIAVVTSPTGAAVRDIIKIAGQRNSSVSITVIPALVQGDMAAESIVEGIRLANRLKKADTIIVGRGGGSIEDLWAFNDERVARAIFSSEIPVISAVGHETDFTIADFVADLRASTPSNAAELAVADINEDKRRAETLIIKLEKYAGIALKNSGDRLKRALESPAFAYPLDNISDKEETVKALMSRLKRETEISVRNTENCVAEKVTALEALSPLKVLARGYSYTENANGNVVTSVDDVQNGGSIFVTLKDGRISASVEDKVMF
ncbi:MAG TPA: exodeoxyribonuclease VII large subunit [Firmicutes bacterium]|nr:exodeoxyribonuclease VII large subunit [Bacillota bacterium]